MKKTILTLALAGTFGVAAAQSMVTSIPATKPAVAGAIAAAPSKSLAPATLTATAPAAAGPATAAAPGVVANAAKPDPHINPFNGKLQSAEQLQRDLEQARMQTQVLEEQLRQTTLNEELKAVPLRKAVEIAQAATAVKKEAVSQKELEAAMHAPKIPVPTAVTAPGASPKPIPVKKVTVPKKVATTVAPTVSAPAPAVKAPAPRPNLVSVLDIAGSRSAVLEFEGATLVAADGQSTPFGVVAVQDQNSVSVGGTTLRVHNATMARFIVSDGKAPTAQGAAGTAGPAAVGTQPAAPVVASPAVTPAASAPAGMPIGLGLPVQANGPIPLPPSTPAMASPGTIGVAAQGAGQAVPLPPGVTLMPEPPM